MARNLDPHGVAVIGLGRFGKSLALELMAEHIEVLGIDKSRKIVDSVAGRLTHVVEADGTDEDALRQLGVHEMDRVVIGISDDLESSILSAAIVSRFGVPNIWAKAISKAHAEILTRVGIDHVVRPEHDMGKRVAHLVGSRMLDYIEFDDGYAIAKARPPKRITGLPLGESRVRSEFGITVVGVKTPGKDFTHATPETVVEQGDLVILSGPQEGVERFSKLL